MRPAGESHSRPRQRRGELLVGRLLAAVGRHRLLDRELQAEQRLRHAVRRLHRVDVVGLRVEVPPPVVQRRLRRHQAVGAARAEDHAVGHLLAEAGQHVVGGREHHLRALEQAARRRLQDEGLQVAAPEAGVGDVGRLGHQRRDLGAVLAGAELRQLVLAGLGAGIELLHRPGEVLLRVLAPGVVLVDHVEGLGLDVLRLQVARQRDVVHGRVRRGAEHVLVLAVLEDARRAAVVEEEELLHLLGRGRDREAVARADVADDGVDLLAVVQVLQLLHLLGGAAVLVDVDGLDLHAAEAGLVVGRRRGALVEGVDQHLGAVDRGNAEALGRLAGEEADDADLERLLGRCGARGEQGGEGECAALRRGALPKISSSCGVSCVFCRRGGCRVQVLRGRRGAATAPTQCLPPMKRGGRAFGVASRAMARQVSLRSGSRWP